MKTSRRGLLYQYADDWRDINTGLGLTSTPQEAEALAEMLEGY